ncbi:MAG: four-carbon acid sugar kinase family protein [Terracidiphilus sp.]
MHTATANPLCKSAPSVPPLPERVYERTYIVADDLTGACDSAAAFLRVNLAVRVWLGATAQFSAAEPVQAFNTESRLFLPARASRIVKRTAEKLASAPHALLFKKIDSAARGPFAAEILAAYRGFGSRAVLLAPAFPAMGRTVRDGILRIRDAAGQRREIDLVSLFPPRARGLIQLVSRPEELVASLGAGRPVLLCDSSTQSDLQSLVRNAENLPCLLFAGSAGLAQAIASCRTRHKRQAAPPSAERTLIVAGSGHPVTKLQLKNLDRTVSHAVKVLRIQHSQRDRARILQAFHALSPQALILTGGDTAQLAAGTLGAHSFILQGECAPGIPWGTVQGGIAEGCVVITKSGGFGTPTTLKEILAVLRGQA